MIYILKLASSHNLTNHFPRFLSFHLEKQSELPYESNHFNYVSLSCEGLPGLFKGLLFILALSVGAATLIYAVHTLKALECRRLFL